VAGEFYAITLWGGLTVLLGAALSWPAWRALAHLFLPARTANALLDWQRSLSGSGSVLARE
jgi:hypothetical protein